MEGQAIDLLGKIFNQKYIVSLQPFPIIELKLLFEIDKNMNFMFPNYEL